MVKLKKIAAALVAVVTTLSLTGCVNGNFLGLVGGYSAELKPSMYFAAGNPKLVTLETVTDQYGTYTRTKSKDPDPVTCDIDPLISATDAADIKKFIINFVIEEALDNRAIDNPDAWPDWVKNEAPKYYHPKYIKQMLKAKTYEDYDGTSAAQGAGLVLSDEHNVMPRLLRDGGPRTGPKYFQTCQISTYIESIAVQLTGSAFYFVSDEGLKEYYSDFFKNDPEFAKAYNEREFLNDHKLQAFTVEFNLTYYLLQDKGSWKIALDPDYFAGNNGNFLNEFNVLLGEAEYPMSPDWVPPGRKGK